MCFIERKQLWSELNQKKMTNLRTYHQLCGTIWKTRLFLVRLRERGILLCSNVEFTKKKLTRLYAFCESVFEHPQFDIVQNKVFMFSKVCCDFSFRFQIDYFEIESILNLFLSIETFEHRKMNWWISKFDTSQKKKKINLKA